jgi:hypothetical protein
MHDKAGFAVRLCPFTRKREFDEPRIILIDPFILICRLVVASTDIVTAVIAERYKAGESMDELAEY